jgi:hypothetical protein
MYLFAMWKYSALVHECRLSIGFHFLDLIANELLVQKHAFNIAAKEWRQLTPVSRLDMVEALLQTLSDPPPAQMNAVEREETLDTSDDTCPLLDQVLALSLDPFCVLFFNSRNTHVSRHFAVA